MHGRYLKPSRWGSVAEGHLQLGQLREVVADDVLVGHADAAVQLNRLLADEAHRLAELVLGAPWRGAAPLPGR